MDLRHFLTQGLALLLLAGLSVGFGGCKPEDADDANGTTTNGDANGTHDDGAHDGAPGDNQDATNGGQDPAPAQDPMDTEPMGDTPGADDPLDDPLDDPTESGSATDNADAGDDLPLIPDASEAGSVTEIPPEKVPGDGGDAAPSPGTPESGSSTD